jgi:iron complex outermembrane recepter protein
VPVGRGELAWNLNVNGKGSRPGSSFDPVTPSIMEQYFLVNTSVAYRQGPMELSVYARNLADEKYFESFIDGTLLAALGLLNQDLGILGARRNVGIRLQYSF